MAASLFGRAERPSRAARWALLVICHGSLHKEPWAGVSYGLRAEPCQTTRTTPSALSFAHTTEAASLSAPIMWWEMAPGTQPPGLRRRL